MKVLLCHNFYQLPGGEDTCFHDEGALLESRGHTVLRYALHNHAVADLGLSRTALKTLWNRQSYDELRALMRREQPDVAHCTNTFPLISPSVYYAAQRERVAVVQALHNYRLLCPTATFLRNGRECEDCLGKAFAWPAIMHGCYRGSRSGTAVVAGMLTAHKLLGTWQRRIDCYYTLTEFARQKFIAGGLPADRILIKPNFVTEPLAVASPRADTAVFVGRLSSEKGVEVLLRAWQFGMAQIPLVIVGDGPLAPLVEQMAREHPQITWVGRQSPEAVAELLAQARCLVLSSLSEVLPRTIIEAFSAGTPVVASGLSGLKEVIDHGRTGLLFEPGNAADLRAKVHQLWAMDGAYGQLRQAAREEYLLRYTAEQNYEMVVGIYRRACELRDQRLRSHVHASAPTAPAAAEAITLPVAAPRHELAVSECLSEVRS